MYYILVFFIISILSPLNETFKGCSNCQFYSKQQTDNVVICDTSKIIFYDREVQDTLIGKAELLIELSSIKCDSIKIKEGKLRFLQLSKKNGEKVFEYRCQTLEDLNCEERKIVLKYEKRVLSTLKSRGLCCAGNSEYLYSYRYAFAFGFTVIPNK